MSRPFLKNIRRFSSGFQSKLPGRRRPSEVDLEDYHPSADDAESENALTREQGRLVLEPADCEAPPPAYSFVEPPETGEVASGVGDTAMNGEEDEQLVGDVEETAFHADAMSKSPDQAPVECNSDLSALPIHQAPEKTWLNEPKTFAATVLTRLPAEVWLQIAEHLDPSSAASLTLSARYLAHTIGGPIWTDLSLPTNITDRIRFLSHFDSALPAQSLCHNCGIYHVRLADPPLSERLRSDDSIANNNSTPSTRCSVPLHQQSTVRLTLTHTLTFTLAHLVTRAQRLGTPYGVPATALTRSWTPPTSPYTTTSIWTHRTSAIFEKPSGHLLLRVTSTHHPRANLTASEQRLVIASRRDYTANYSTCWHERRVGEEKAQLGGMLRCALGHVPSGISSDPKPGQALRGMSHLASQCASCRPLRRCLLCPTEYLVELKLVDQAAGRRRRSSSSSDGTAVGSGSRSAQGMPVFAYALTLTRYTDLGKCETPSSKEWAASAAKWSYNDKESVLYVPTGKDKGEAPTVSVRRRFEIASGMGGVSGSEMRSVALWKNRGPALGGGGWGTGE